MPLKANEPQWSQFIAWVAVYLVISGLVTWLAYAWISGNIGRPASLEVTILVIKAVSLVALVIIGGAEITRSKQCPWLLKALTGAVMACAGVIAMLLVVKIVVVESQSVVLARHVVAAGSWFPFKPTYVFVYKFGDYLAISPLVVYACLNGLTSLVAWVQGNRSLQKEALAYFFVSDVPCLIPILGVFSLVAGVEGSIVHRDMPGRVFVSGAMAMFILTSNLLTLVVRYIVHPALGLEEACDSTNQTAAVSAPNSTLCSQNAHDGEAPVVA